MISRPAEAEDGTFEMARAYRHAQNVGGAEPDAAIDANVLAAARRHLAQKQARTLVSRPQRTIWHRLMFPAALACVTMAMLVVGVQHESGSAGVVQPASVRDGLDAPGSAPMAAPGDMPRVPAVNNANDICKIRAQDALAAEIKRLEQAGCAASVARLPQASGIESNP